MKKLFPFAIVTIVLSLTSCKKDYTCTCVEIVPGLPQITQIYPLPKMTKKSAESACNSESAVSIPTYSVSPTSITGFSFACHL